jgi:hypothetical protein
MREVIDTGAKYVIALVVIIGCFVLIYQGKGDQVQPWTVIGLVVGWIIRDSAGNSSAANVARIAASQPNVVASSGPPNTLSVTPSTDQP